MLPSSYERMEHTTCYQRNLHYVHIAANIVGWFVVSIFLTLYNKLSVTTWGMDFPLTITCFHLVMRMPMAAAAMRYLGVRAARFSWRELFVSVFPVSVMIAQRHVDTKAGRGSASPRG